MGYVDFEFEASKWANLNDANVVTNIQYENCNSNHSFVSKNWCWQLCQKNICPKRISNKEYQTMQWKAALIFGTIISRCYVTSFLVSRPMYTFLFKTEIGVTTTSTFKTPKVSPPHSRPKQRAANLQNHRVHQYDTAWYRKPLEAWPLQAFRRHSSSPHPESSTGPADRNCFLKPLKPPHVQSGAESKNRPADGNWCPDHPQTPGRFSKEQLKL